MSRATARGYHDDIHMTNRQLILVCSRKPFERVEGDGPVYRKELAYKGDFVKKNSRGQVEFELPVDDALMDHWVATFQEMKKNKVPVPVPLEHTTDPESRRGTVVDLRKEPNPERNGEDALFAYIEFADEATGEKLSKTTDVSLFSPPDFVDGKGRRYVRPIRHVALTDYPLVPGLSKFTKAIAASTVVSADDLEDLGADPIDPIDEGAHVMTIAELADRLGVEYEEGADDEAIAQAIEDAWDAPPAGEEEELAPEGGEDEFLPAEEEEPMDEGMGDDPMLEDEEDEEDEEMMASHRPVVRRATMRASASPRIVSAIARARRIELEQLTRDRKIDPATRDRLAQKFCTAKHVAFALSHDAASVLDDYDDVVAALAAGGPKYRTGSRTAGQGYSRDDDKSPIVRNAEARAAANDRSNGHKR